MINEKDYFYMRKAIELSQKGIGHTKSNPIVGCLIVKNDNIIGYGYHEKYGKAHAEINAIENSTDSVANSTMYVTLEPCFHYGKTPPCVKRIISEKIKRVVIGIEDPNPLVSGKSIALMRKSGIQVETGLYTKEISKLNESFIYFIKNNRPFVTIKSAMSIDGKIACSIGDSKWISCEKSREYTNKLRGVYNGIMVGINTVTKDNPSLTCRTEGFDNPIKIIIDTNLKIPLESNVLKNKDIDKTYIYTCADKTNEKFIHLNNLKNVEVVKVSSKNNQVNLKDVIKDLGSKNISSIIVEGGGSINYSMIEENLVQKIVFIIAPKIIGGKESLTPVEGTGFNTINETVKLNDVSIDFIENDIVVEGYL